MASNPSRSWDIRTIIKAFITNMRIHNYSWKILTIALFPLCVFTGWLISKSEDEALPEPPGLPSLTQTTTNAQQIKVTPKPTPVKEKTHAFTIGDHRLIITESPRNNLYGEPEASASATVISPYPYVLDIGPGENNTVTYEVNFLSKDNKVLDNNWIPRVERTVRLNIDQDQETEVIVEWLIPTGVSDGTRSISVFDLVNNALVPLSFLPKFNEDGDGLVLTDTKMGKQYHNTFTQYSYRTEYVDLNKDKRYELLLYTYDWMPDESHYDLHFWNLYVYELVNGQPQMATWWNGGKRYETEEKLGFEKKDRDTIMRYYKELVNQ